VHENGAYVVLLEYDNMEGLILSTEVTKKRVKSVNKFLKIGKQETMMVIRVDREKRYIDLSKKKVQPGEALEAEKRFKKSKMVHIILKQTAAKLNCKLIKLYEKFGWELYKKYNNDAYDAFRMIMNDPESVFSKIDISDLEKKVLYDNISKKMAPTAIKLRAAFELTCFTYEGVDALKEALLTSKKETNDENFQVAVSTYPH
jgi:translation initiation factor 2 subunit 1